VPEEKSDFSSYFKHATAARVYEDLFFAP